MYCYKLSKSSKRFFTKPSSVDTTHSMCFYNISSIPHRLKLVVTTSSQNILGMMILSKSSEYSIAVMILFKSSEHSIAILIVLAGWNIEELKQWKRFKLLILYFQIFYNYRTDRTNVYMSTD